MNTPTFCEFTPLPSPFIEDKMDISIPIFMIGYKDEIDSKNQIKKDLALDIIFNILIGESSELYQELYEEGLLQTEPSFIYENSKTYSHILIQGQSIKYDEVVKRIEKEVEKLKQNGISDENFERTKKKLYGEYVKGYNNVARIANNFLQNYFRNINPLDYFEEFNGIDKEYLLEILNDCFNKELEVVSVIKSK